MAKKRKKLTTEERALVRETIDGVRRELHQVIELLQSKLR